MFDRWPLDPLGPCDRDHIKAAAEVLQPMTVDETERPAGHAELLVGINRLAWMTLLMRGPRFDLAEDDNAPVDGDQIHFAQRTAILPRNDLIAEPFQKPFGGPFASFAQRPRGAPSLPRVLQSLAAACQNLPSGGQSRAQGQRLGA